MKIYCDQCGEEIEIGENAIRTDFHFIHEECEDDYIDMMKRNWEYDVYWGDEEDKIPEEK